MPPCTALTRWSLRIFPDAWVVVALHADVSSIFWSLLICFTSPSISCPSDWVTNESPLSVESVTRLSVVVDTWVKVVFLILDFKKSDWVDSGEDEDSLTVVGEEGSVVIDEVNAVVDEVNVVDLDLETAVVVLNVDFVTAVVVLNVVVVVDVSGLSFVAAAVEVWMNSSLILPSKVGVVIEVVSCLMIVLYWIFNASKVGSVTWEFASFDFDERVTNFVGVGVFVVGRWCSTTLIDGRLSRRFVESVGKFLNTFGMVVTSLCPSSWTTTESVLGLVKEFFWVLDDELGSDVFSIIFLKISSFSNSGIARAMSLSWSGTNRIKITILNSYLLTFTYPAWSKWLSNILNNVRSYLINPFPLSLWSPSVIYLVKGWPQTTNQSSSTWNLESSYSYFSGMARSSWVFLPMAFFSASPVGLFAASVS